jgi:hypothetical protein
MLASKRSSASSPMADRTSWARRSSVARSLTPSLPSKARDPCCSAMRAQYAATAAGVSSPPWPSREWRKAKYSVKLTLDRTTPPKRLATDRPASWPATSQRAISTAPKARSSESSSALRMTRIGGSARRSQSARSAGSAPRSFGATRSITTGAVVHDGASPSPITPEVVSTSTIVLESPTNAPTLQRYGATRGMLTCVARIARIRSPEGPATGAAPAATDTSGSFRDRLALVDSVRPNSVLFSTRSAHQDRATADTSGLRRVPVHRWGCLAAGDHGAVANGQTRMKGSLPSSKSS